MTPSPIPLPTCACLLPPVIGSSPPPPTPTHNPPPPPKVLPYSRRPLTARTSRTLTITARGESSLRSGGELPYAHSIPAMEEEEKHGREEEEGKLKHPTPSLG